MEKVLRLGNQIIAYRKSGRGKKTLFSFHGYGLNHRSWKVFDKVLSDKYTCYHLDLPLHGKSSIASNSFEDVVKAVIRAEQLRPPYNLISFSLGSNYLFSLIQSGQLLIESSLCLAPDGLKSFNHKLFLTKSILGKVIMKQFIKAPILTRFVLRTAKLAGIMQRKKVDFFLSSIETKEMRQNLFDRWKDVGELNVSWSKVEKAIQKGKSSMTMVFGLQDKVIKPRDANKINKALIKVKLKNSGHNMMTHKMIGTIEEWAK